MKLYEKPLTNDAHRLRLANAVALYPSGVRGQPGGHGSNFYLPYAGMPPHAL